MITIFDLGLWHTLTHNQDQMALFENVEFIGIQGHSNLCVADVTEEEAMMLVFMGCNIDHTIAIDLPSLDTRTRMLYKSGNEYVIIEIHHANIPYSKT